MALTKAVESVDAWAKVTAGTLREGATIDITPNYETTLHIDVSLAEAGTESIGAVIKVQVASNSTGDADWQTLTSFGGPTGTAFKRDISADEAAGQTVISVDAPITNNLDHLGKQLFIENTATAANSEIVYQVANSADVDDTITIQDVLLNAQAAADGDIWSINGTDSVVAQYVVALPMSANRVRVLYDNILATGMDIFSRCRITKVTAV